MSRPPIDIELRMAKCLIALEAISEPLDEHGPRLITRLPAALGVIGNTLDTEFSKELDNPSDSESPAAFVERIRDIVLAQAREACKRSPEAATEVIAALEAALDQAMSTATEQPCLTTWHLVLDLAKRTYSQVKLPATLNPDATQLRIVPTDKIPHPFDCSIAICAQTIPLVPRDVKLQVFVGRCDWTSLLALPYALLHECIVHVFQCPLGNASDPYSSYAEGWMDQFTLMTLDASTKRPTELGGALPQPKRVMEAANEYHKARMEYYRKERLAARWKVGADGCTQLRRALHIHYGKARGDRLLRKLSTAINTSGIDHPDRNRFAETLERALPKPEQGLTLGSRPIPANKLAFLQRLRPIVDDFAASGDVRGLVAGVLELSSSIFPSVEV